MGAVADPPGACARQTEETSPLAGQPKLLAGPFPRLFVPRGRSLDRGPGHAERGAGEFGSATAIRRTVSSNSRTNGLTATIATQPARAALRACEVQRDQAGPFGSPSS